MKQIRDRVAGLDVHRDSVVACVRVSSRSEVVVDKQRFPATTAGLSALAAWLGEAGPTTVVMESTGVYWKPVYYALEGLFEELWVCNAQHVKNVPGRKSDMSDAEWLADVAAHGMVRPSFVPPPEIRELRDLTRHRKSLVDTRSREVQRLDKVLQDAGVKLTSVASKAWGASARQMVEALIAGERDPAVLAELAKSRMRSKIPQLTDALLGHFGPHHAILCREIIDHIDFLDAQVAHLTESIAERLGPFEPQVALLCTIPGVGRTTAEVFVAETGGDMSCFPTPGQLAAWVGVAPASHESAGKHRPAGTRRGNRWLLRQLVEAAWASSRTKGTYLGAQHRRIARRRGPNRANVAVAHSIVVMAWHMLSTGEAYTELGEDYFTRRQGREHQARALARKLQDLGYEVAITDKAA